MMAKINFIHIPKNGGVTIQRSELSNRISFSSANKLKSKQYTKDLLLTMKKYGEHHGFGHARWKDLHEEYQMNPSFAIVRNPWSKVVSRYTFLLKVFSIIRHGSFYVMSNQTNTDQNDKLLFTHKLPLSQSNANKI